MAYDLNYRHLYYFWVVAQEGGIARAANRLGMAVQTVSAQVRDLERSLGCTLLKPSGRGVTLTEAGHAAVRQADAIFQLGEQLRASVQATASTPQMRLVVGLSDGLPKLVVRHLLQPVMLEPQLRLLCHENQFDDLLAELALHRLDVVIADRPAPQNPNLKVYSHALGTSAVAWYGPPPLATAAKRGFPQSLSSVPLLLPTQHSALRARLDAWLEREGVRARIAGEFEDSALLKTFGAGGMGVFPSTELMHDDLVERYGVRRIGPCTGVDEHFFAIAATRKIQHPLVQRILPERG